MRCGMVLSGELKGNYAGDNGRSIYENNLRRLAQLQAEYNSLVGTVGRALPEAHAQLETQLREFVQVARQGHAVDDEEEQIRDYLIYLSLISSALLPTMYQAANLFRIKNRLSRLLVHVLRRKAKLSVQKPEGANEVTKYI
jgi:hypothetical protein